MGRHLVSYLIKEIGLKRVIIVDKVPPALAWLDEEDTKIFDSDAVEFRSANLVNAGAHVRRCISVPV